MYIQTIFIALLVQPMNQNDIQVKKLFKIKFCRHFNETSSVFRVTYLNRIWTFYNKARYGVETFISWSEVEKLLKIKFCRDFNETLIVFRVRIFNNFLTLHEKA